MRLHESRYSYATGFRTRIEAESAIDSMMQEARISLDDNPRVESYSRPMPSGDSVIRWRVSLADRKAPGVADKRLTHRLNCSYYRQTDQNKEAGA